MGASAAGKRTWVQALSVHARGHIFRFDSPVSPSYGAATGLRLLLLFFVLEGIVGPRFSLFIWLRLPLPPALARVVIQLGLALAGIRWVARLPWSLVGLRPWREWNRVERSYFIQVLILANVIFGMFFAGRGGTESSGASGGWAVGIAVLTSFVWGFYQEVMYRGILQTELVRRGGAIAGVLIANCLYTFGPLHFYHFQRGAAAFPMFAAIFAIGLFFGVLFQRSGNLWMVAVFHGIGDAYLLGG